MRKRFSEMGNRSQAVRRAAREAEITPEFLMDLASAQPFGHGAAIGSLEYRNFLTGRVTRWTILRGDRINNYQLRSPDGRVSRPHGLAWLLEKVRVVILRR